MAGDSFDTAEAATLPPVLGILHPTGYPLYTLVGRAAVATVPGAEPARVMNLLSAALMGAAAGITLWFLSLAGSPGFAAAVALLFFTSATVLPYATVASVYPLHALLAALVLATALAGARRGAGSRVRLLSAYGAGLLVTHHVSSVLLLPGWAVLFAAGSMRARRVAWEAIGGAALLLLGATTVLYLPLRDAANPPVAPSGGIDSLRAFTDFVTGRTFHGLIDFHPGALLPRARRAAEFFLRDWTLAGLLAAAWGARSMIRRDRAAGCALLLVAGLNAVFCVGYALEKVYVYFLPAHLVTAAWIVRSLEDVREAVGRWLGPGRAALVARASVAGLAIVAVAAGAPRAAHLGRRHDDRVDSYARAALAEAGQGAVIVAWDSYYWGLRYRQLLHGERADVRVDYVETMTPSVEDAILAGRPAYFVPPSPEGWSLAPRFSLEEIAFPLPARRGHPSSLVQVSAPVSGDTASAGSGLPVAGAGLAGRFMLPHRWRRGEIVGTGIAWDRMGAAMSFHGRFSGPDNDYAELMLPVHPEEVAGRRTLRFDYHAEGAGLLLFVWLKEADPSRWERHRVAIEPGASRHAAIDLDRPEKTAAAGFDPARAATLHWIVDDDPDSLEGDYRLVVSGLAIE